MNHRIEPAAFGRDLGDDRFDNFERGEIARGGNQFRVRHPRLEPGDCIGNALLARAMDADYRPAFRRLRRDLEADGAGRAGDQHDLAGWNVSHFQVPCFLLSAIAPLAASAASFASS